jgi:hypothetical protein
MYIMSFQICKFNPEIAFFGTSTFWYGKKKKFIFIIYFINLTFESYNFIK